MIHGRIISGLIVTGLLVSFPAGGSQLDSIDGNDDAQSQFLRLQRDDNDEAKSLDTAVISYVPNDPSRPGLVVDLVGAVHIADRQYYEKLNRLFDSYDVLLYELVAPAGTRIRKGRASQSTHPVSALQRGIKTMLELEFQLDSIDYTKKNFVHADLSPDEFAKSMKVRGESFTQLFLRMMGQAMAIQSRDPGRSSDIQLLAALLSRDRALRLKRIMAEQFEQLGGSMLVMDDTTIITQRNKRAVSVLLQQINKGKKRIGIFYGAAHMPDMETRIVNECNLRKSRERWFTAWDLTRAANLEPIR